MTKPGGMEDEDRRTGRNLRIMAEWRGSGLAAFGVKPDLPSIGGGSYFDLLRGKEPYRVPWTSQVVLKTGRSSKPDPLSSLCRTLGLEMHGSAWHDSE
jgi:hypothetical protein